MGEHNGSLRVRIAAPPVDGAANEELIRVLAKVFEVPRSSVHIAAGHSGKLKQVQISNMEHRRKLVEKVLTADKR